MVTSAARWAAVPGALTNDRFEPRIRHSIVAGACLALFFLTLALYQFPTTRIAVLDTQVPYFALALIPVLALAAARLDVTALRRALPLLGIVGLLALATCVSGLAHPDQDWGEALKRLAYVGVGIVVFALASDQAAFRIGLATYALTAAAMAVVGFMLLAQGFGEASQTFYFGLHYSTSTRNGDAYFLLLPVFIALGFLSTANTPRPLRWLAALAFVLLTAGIGLSFSRGAWLAAAAGLGLFLLLARGHRRPVLGVLAAMAVAAVLILPQVGRGGVATMLADRAATIAQLNGSAHNSSAERLRLLEDTARLIAASPFTGVGVGLLERAYGDMPDVLGLAHAEDAYLTVFAEYGILGFAALVAFVAWPLARLGYVPSPLGRGGGGEGEGVIQRWGVLRLALFCGLVALALNGLTDNPVASASYWILPLFVGAAE